MKGDTFPERKSKDFVIRVSASFYDFLVEMQKKFYEQNKKRISFVQLTDMIGKCLWGDVQEGFIIFKTKTRKRKKFAILEDYDFFKFEL
jgi:hypothetical protein